MAVTDVWTLAEAEEQLTAWKTALKALASGTVKAYKIGSRELTMLDMKDIHQQIGYFSRVIAALKSGFTPSSVRTVVFRDL